MANRTLGGGRGSLPTTSGQLESYDRRREEIPSQDGWILWGPQAGRWATTTAATLQNTINLSVLPILDRDMQLAEARTYTSLGTGFIKSGIYVVDPRTLDLSLVPGTKTAFPIDAAEEKTVQAKGILRAGHRYCVGTLVTSGSNTSVSQVRTSTAGWEKTLTFASTEIVNKIPFKALGKSSVTSVPVVVYFSELAARFM